MMGNNTKVLSDNATQEILGDDLCFLVAFGKNGEIIPYIRGGLENASELGDFNPLKYLDIKFTITPTSGKTEAAEIMALGKNCWYQGRWIYCPGACPV